MKINLIIEALELALAMEFECEHCIYQCISAGSKCRVDGEIKKALAEARKMQEPCVWVKRLTTKGDCYFETSCEGMVDDDDFRMEQFSIGSDIKCPYCGRKIGR